jgi:hypothetical protein
MSAASQRPRWQASDLKWYPLEHNSDYGAPLPPARLTGCVGGVC